MKEKSNLPIFLRATSYLQVESRKRRVDASIFLGHPVKHSVAHLRAAAENFLSGFEDLYFAQRCLSKSLRNFCINHCQRLVYLRSGKESNS